MLLYWYLPAIIFLGIVTSYEDLKMSKIRNKWITGGLIYVILLYHFFYLFYNPYGLQLGHLQGVLLNGVLAFFVGFLLWKANFWTAGDAKLFFVYVLLIPPSTFSRTTNIFFIDFLINIFVPIALYLMFSTLEKTTLSEKMVYIKKTLHWEKLVTLVLFLFVLSWVISTLAKIFSIPNLTTALILIIALLIQGQKILFMGKTLIVLIFLAAIRVLFDPSLLHMSTWTSFLLLVAFFIILRFFLVGLSFEAFTKKVPIKDLKPGLLPAELVFKEGRKYKKQKLLLGPLTPELSEKESVFTLTSSGLSKKDIAAIKKIPSVKTLHVQETMSFAPYLFVGVLLQLFLQTNVVSYARLFLGF